MSKPGTTYWPASFVTRVRTAPVYTLLTRIATFATTAPLGSVAVPTIVASCANARTGKQRSSRQRKILHPVNRCLAVWTVSANNNEDKGHTLVPPHQTSSGYRQRLEKNYDVKIRIGLARPPVHQWIDLNAISPATLPSVIQTSR